MEKIGQKDNNISYKRKPERPSTHQARTCPPHHQGILLKRVHSRLSEITPAALGVLTSYSLK